MRGLILAVALSSSLWGPLERGPHAVGFQQWERYDYTRVFWSPQTLDGKPRTFERARPMRVSIWYPAVASGAAPLTLADYVDMIGGEDRFDRPLAEQKRLGRAAFYAFPLLRTATPEQRAALERLPSLAQRNAQPARGKFPLILYSLGSPALAHVTAEYLASHGYVVMQMPRLGAFAGLPPDSPTDTADKVADTDFLLQAAHDFPSADVHNVGAIGFSAGGRWALSEAMKNIDVRAVVSLETVMLFNDAATREWKKLPYFNPATVRAPVLHMMRREWVPREDPSMWEALRFADRTSMVFEDPALDHLDFQGIGYAMTRAGMRADAAPSVAAAFEVFNRTTLAFLNAHLREAAAFKPPSPPKVTVSHTAAAAAPVRLIDVMNSVAEGNIDPILKADVPEDVVNLAGYNMLGAGRVADAIKLFQYNVDRHPQSANAFDSLADGYVAAGDAVKGTELARRAAALLDADPSIVDADRKQRIRESIGQKLAPRR